ncbi:nuclear factor 7, ovary-like [Cheilinus undulatus]|uniref:nuclear factor 7, ovary-like n=1 Tax=Cheilinus undulatus TaxID=241271 RepID=UPI001BD26731|nr:nuclear factor 7, ovary-like [Cheilinus undulatus]XP_041648968.1 nuclear factor 7, ovary-like [Cheilinus undulatus]
MEQLKSDLKYLQDKREEYQEAEKTCSHMGRHCDMQLEHTVGQSQAEFKMLQQFLRDEEECRVVAVNEEYDTKRKLINIQVEKNEDQISSLSQIINEVEEVLLTKSCPSSLNAIQGKARALCSVADPHLLSGLLIDVSKHIGNLSVQVWKKMKDRLSFSPIILDPNTSNLWLHLSYDLAGLRHGDTALQIPDNPRRNTKGTTVLGSEGFSSGKHSWDVEVGDLPTWSVGVAQELEEEDDKPGSPKYRVWAFAYVNGDYKNGFGGTVAVKKSPQKVQVQLDYDGKEVSFYDPEDMTELLTHKQNFTEKVFPFFCVTNSGDAKTTETKICPQEISL